MRNTQEWKQVKNGIRAKFAWPGGYPLFAVTLDGAALCIDCARKEFQQIARAHHNSFNDGWCVVAVDINYEDTSLHCDHCSKPIESAYGEDSIAAEEQA